MNAAESSYGSDASGLVFGYVFAPGASGRPVGSAEVEVWLQELGAKAGPEFIWLHFNAAHAASERWLQQHLELAPARP
jgi:zinc transporter